MTTMAKRRQARPHKQEKSISAPAAAERDGSGSLWYIGILAALLGFCLYANTLEHDYCYDDSSAIINNYLVKGGIKNIGTFFFTEYRSGYQVRRQAGHQYRPLTPALFAVMWQLAPNKPGLYHFVNVLLYGLTGWLLWITWRRILKNYPPVLPALGVLLFMAHPVHTEVVANIKSLDEILSLLFGTVALYGLWRFADEQKPLWLAGAVMAYGLALFSKEGAIVFIGLFPLTLWFFSEKKPVGILKLSAWFLLPAGLFLVMRAQVLAGQSVEVKISGISNYIVLAPTALSRIASALDMCWRYLAVLLVPHPLVSDMGYPQVKPSTFADWHALAGLVIYGGMALWALWQARLRCFPAFAVLFFLISFSLASNLFFLIGTNYGERLLYLPSLGFAFALAWVLTKIFPAALSVGKPPVLLLAAAGLILALYGVKTVSRNPDWKSDSTLFEADMRVSPDSAMLMHHYGIQCLYKGCDAATGSVQDAGMVKKSIELFTKAYEAFPNSQTIGYRGLAHSRLKEYDLAIADYEKAIVHKPDSHTALNSLGFLYRSARNQPDKAEELYRRAVAAEPRFVLARRNLGAILATRGKFAEAIEQWKEGLKSAPDDFLLNQYIGRACKDMGQPDLGKPFLQKASQVEKMQARKPSLQEEAED
jgi:tetratricopeptide (TPR) repeat protein